MEHTYSSSYSSIPVSKTATMKPLSERQQIALLMQMTAEENSTPTRRNNIENEGSSSTPRSVNRRNERGETPLHVASVKGDLIKLKSLINQGANVNTTDFAGSITLPAAGHYIFVLIYFGFQGGLHFTKPLTAVTLL